MKLQNKLDEIKKDFQAKAPKEVLTVMHRATEDLLNSRIMAQVIQVGDKAPDFTLKNTKERDISLSGLLSAGSLVLGFYRGRW